MRDYTKLVEETVRGMVKEEKFMESSYDDQYAKKRLKWHLDYSLCKENITVPNNLVRFLEWSAWQYLQVVRGRVPAARAA